MKLPKFLLGLAISAAVIIPSMTAAIADSRPPAPKSAGETITDTVFSAVEKRIIRDYYDKIPGSEVIRDVITEEMDDDARDKSGKYKYKEKHKSKGKNKGLPPGLAKRKSLPPGLAKKSQLPPGLTKRDIPDDLLKQLPPPPKGTTVNIVDDRVVLVEKATGVVLDILTDVIVGKQ